MACNFQSDGTFICQTVSCVPPLVYNGVTCICPSGQLPVQGSDGPACQPQLPILVFPSECKVTMSYVAQSPDLPQIVSSGPPGCDAGIELALATVLAALLKSR